MSFEATLVIGIVLAALSLVAVLGALIEGRRAYVSGLVVLISAGMIYWANTMKPEGLELADIPEAFITLVAAVLN